MSNLKFVIGSTGSGKSTFLQAAQIKLGDAVGLVEVGKLLRAKYGPDYFKGQAAPDHTEAEAWKMCVDTIEEHRKAGKQLILVDGQPRSMKQCRKVMEIFFCPPSALVSRGSLFKHKGVVHIFAPTEVREERLRKRDAGNEAALNLSMARLKGDIHALFEVYSTLSANCIPIRTFDTSDPKYSPHQVLEELCS